MSRARLDPHRPVKRDPPAPHEMVERLTPTSKVIVLCHLGVPRLDGDQWSLAIDGLVERPRTVRFDDLMRYAPHQLTSVHQCCGSPLAPFEPTRRVSNVTWTGVRLADVLADCRPRAEARYVWSYGADWGEFNGVTVDAYAKDLPMSRVDADVLIAYEMNGLPLAAEHGFPARLVVPGFYGTNSVKWLARLTLSDRRALGPFTNRWYNDPVRDGAGRETGAVTPVWSVAPESVIVSPSPDARIERAVEQEIWGWAWADGGVRSVYVDTGDGLRRGATVEPPNGRQWQSSSLSWKPTQLGSVVLAAHAEAFDGAVQPASGRRNAVHEVRANVA